MTVPATLADGVRVELATFDGQALALSSPRAFAPGAPFVVIVTIDERHVDVQLKAHGSKRVADDRFEVRARTVGLRREDRERLLEMLR